MNILICSVGRRVKLVEYFKETCHETGGVVITVDCDATAAGLYFADHYEIVPQINHPDYISVIKQICRKYKINAILSLIDPELILLAQYKDEFEREGVRVIVSDENVVKICFDKHLTYQYLCDHHLPCVPTFTKFHQIVEEIQRHEISFPLIVKPRKGSASIGITTIHSIKDLKLLIDEESMDNLIVQPFIKGEEFGIDCYVDIVSKEVVSIFLKKKVKMRAGETDKSIAVKDNKLMELILRLLSTLDLVGPIDIDCFKTENGYVISEINPRFGGGYLHAYEAGHNYVNYIVNNISGKRNIPKENNYKDGTILVKYDSFVLID
ncbi:ATP-grasp domain-containing protein [Bacillus sp. UMB0728]|uniref:ATP-grasp domain-containing protein n=1 Tax=Bacillus sp. UMB0728 TaxID=2066052 RepID=UPI000C7660D3|nr:ATP-grasp domain-containing protein [Bacillus sp. UMB0728]PLR73531.1 carbamoylphosphate synthase large subunit [Bacillus sp. UMB0728]